MSVQTRTQLQASALTITNETTAGANTAARVGGLFDDLADTATLNRERGYASLLLSGTTTFETTEDVAVPLQVAMAHGILSTYNFSRNAAIATITYTGATALSTALKVSANLSFVSGNNHRYKWYIAKNATIIPESLADMTTKSSDYHSVYFEAYLTGTLNDVFSIYVNSINGDYTITISALNFTAVTL